ncbi:winged helix-turn-helix transcriptional regulator [Myxococcus faecalis]|uniref:winged helix-turn-helix transcriptional regulator n=1 Tax=Myxococcus faecalis TaxID=3115646 RepID=UPI0038CF4AC1
MVRRQSAADCDLGVARAFIGGRWKSAILCELYAGPVRFGELRRRVRGVSEKVLFEQLRELEAAGVVGRAVFDEVPPKEEYSLTPTGLTLAQAAHPLVEWGLRHAAQVSAEPH